MAEIQYPSLDKLSLRQADLFGETQEEEDSRLEGLMIIKLLTPVNLTEWYGGVHEKALIEHWHKQLIELGTRVLAMMPFVSVGTVRPLIQALEDLKELGCATPQSLDQLKGVRVQIEAEEKMAQAFAERTDGVVRIFRILHELVEAKETARSTP